MIGTPINPELRTARRLIAAALSLSLVLLSPGLEPYRVFASMGSPSIGSRWMNANLRALNWMHSQPAQGGSPLSQQSGLSEGQLKRLETVLGYTNLMLADDHLNAVWGWDMEFRRFLPEQFRTDPEALAALAPAEQIRSLGRAVDDAYQAMTADALELNSRMESGEIDPDDVGALAGINLQGFYLDPNVQTAVQENLIKTGGLHTSLRGASREKGVKSHLGKALAALTGSSRNPPARFGWESGRTDEALMRMEARNFAAGIGAALARGGLDATPGYSQALEDLAVELRQAAAAKDHAALQRALGKFQPAQSEQPAVPAGPSSGRAPVSINNPHPLFSEYAARALASAADRLRRWGVAPAAFAAHLVGGDAREWSSGAAGADQAAIARGHAAIWASRKILDHADQTRGFSFREIATIVTGASILAFSGVLFVLALGYLPSMAPLAAIFAYIGLQVGRKGIPRATEVNRVQAVMNIAGGLTNAAAVLAALFFLSHPVQGKPVLNDVPLLTMTLWLTITSCLGVLISIPLRGMMLDTPKGFPRAVVTADLIKTLVEKGSTAIAVLKGSAVVAAVIAIGRTVLETLKVVKTWAWTSYGLGVAPSPSYLVIGGIMLDPAKPYAARRLMYWLLGVSLLTWGILAPVFGDSMALDVARIFQADMSSLHAVRDVARALHLTPFLVLSKWTMWPAITLYVFYGMTSLAFNWKMLKDSFSVAKERGVGRQGGSQLWIYGGIAACVIALTAFLAPLGVPVAATAMAVGLAGLSVFLGLRSEKETGITPTSSFGALNPALMRAFGFLDPTVHMSSLVITTTAMSASVNAMNDFKTAKEIGTPFKQIIRRYLGFGVPLGIALAVGMFWLLKTVKGFGGGGYAAPTAHVYEGTIKVLKSGLQNFSPSLLAAIAAAIAAGIGIALYENRKDPAGKKKPVPLWLPHPLAFLLGSLTQGLNIAAMFLGWALALALNKWRPGKFKEYSIPILAGLLSGEMGVSFIVSILQACGILHK